MRTTAHGTQAALDGLWPALLRSNAMISHGELRNRLLLALCLAVPCIAVALIVPPRGNFPLNDDWVYAKLVEALAERGQLALSPLSNAFAVTQTIYGAALTSLFGFSFALLRCSTLVLAWATLCLVAFTARELGLPNRSAVAAAATLGVNPIFINLTYTFMTDVPFCALSAASAYFFVKALRHFGITPLLLGNVFAVAAFYNRQLGALLPVAFLVAAQWRGDETGFRIRRGHVAAMIVPWLAAAGLLALLWVGFEPQVEAKGTDGAPIPVAVLYVLLYLGAFFVPLLPSLAFPATRFRRRWIRVAVLSFVLFGATYFSFVFPFFPNIVRAIGAGALTFSIPDRPDLDARLDAAHSSGVLLVILVVSAALALDALVTALGRSKTAARSPRRMQYIFLATCATLFALAPLARGGPYFDRYLLPAIGPLALVLAATMGYRPNWKRLALVCVLLSAFAAYSTICLQDYLAWNTARWRAVDLLRTKYAAKDTEINAGYEFNGMYTSDEYLRRLRESPAEFRPLGSWVVDEKYLVYPIRIDEATYDEIERVPYFTWLGFTTRHLYVYRRTA